MQKLAPDTLITSNAEAAFGNVDLVYLACPPAPRKAYALAASAQGKAVFLEKPLGVDVAESRILVRELTAAGVPSAVNFTQAAGRALTNVSEESKARCIGRFDRRRHYRDLSTLAARMATDGRLAAVS